MIFNNKKYFAFVLITIIILKIFGRLKYPINIIRVAVTSVLSLDSEGYEQEYLLR